MIFLWIIIDNKNEKFSNRTFYSVLKLGLNMLNTIMGTWPNSWYLTLQNSQNVPWSRPCNPFTPSLTLRWGSCCLLEQKSFHTYVQRMTNSGAGAIQRHTADKTGTGTDGWWERQTASFHISHTKYIESIAANQPPASHTWLGAWNASSYAASIAALPHPHSFGPIFLLCELGFYVFECCCLIIIDYDNPTTKPQKPKI